MDRFFIVWFICIVGTVLIFEIACLRTPFLNRFYYLVAKNVFCLVIGHWLFLSIKGSIFKKHVNSNKRAVFITGCDSGFGFQLAKRLDSKGYHVFAGCLFPTSGGAAELLNSCSSRFCTVHIDVTQDDSVQKAKGYVENNLGDCELWAVVNNAGIFKGLSVELTPISSFEDILQVNTLGQVRVTKAFLPLLRRSKGRIVNVNSMAGRTSYPFMSGYSMSKFAAVAFSECLRREIDTSGIKVISIEPEFFKTTLCSSKNLKKQLDIIKSNTEENFKSSVGKKYIKRMQVLYTYIEEISSPNIHYVIDAMEAGVSAQHPCLSYSPRGNTVRHILLYGLLNAPEHIADAIFKIFNMLEPALEKLFAIF